MARFAAIIIAIGLALAGCATAMKQQPHVAFPKRVVLSTTELAQAQHSLKTGETVIFSFAGEPPPSRADAGATPR
jgi:hypothetical protein